MPELAEVEHGRVAFERVGLGRRIVEAWVADDDIVVEGVAPDELEAALEGATVTGTGRHGKQLWVELDRRPWLGVHFGMTGGFRTQGDQPLRLDASPAEVDRSWPPRFTKLLLRFDDGGQLAFTNARRLGRLRLRHDPRSEPPINKLGYDPYLTLPEPEAFAAMLSRRSRARLKGLLLDQRFAAGMGNWLADEVLYQARLDPRRTVGSLSDEERERIRLTLRRIVVAAVEVEARKDAFPRSWLFHYRWGKTEGAEVEGRAIEFLQLSGRTTAWVPEVQR